MPFLGEVPPMSQPTGHPPGIIPGSRQDTHEYSSSSSLSVFSFSSLTLAPSGLCSLEQREQHLTHPSPRRMLGLKQIMNEKALDVYMKMMEESHLNTIPLSQNKHKTAPNEKQGGEKSIFIMVRLDT